MLNIINDIKIIIKQNKTISVATNAVASKSIAESDNNDITN